MTQNEKVKQYLINGIQSKQWQAEDRLPSENELVSVCDVSRMTARRAIKELEAKGLIYSIRGKGTFISQPKHQSSAVELRNIADEIRSRNHVYQCEIIEMQAKQCSELCQQLDIASNFLFYSSVIHYENGAPLQLEQRYVNPDLVPDYLAIDLTKVTAHEYLMQQCPAHEVGNQIEAVTATVEQRKLLHLADEEPCLKVTRTTYYQDTVASFAILYHPGTRYVLGTQFSLKG